ncbi:hypothetical protein ACTU6V_05465 [Microbacterium sp. A204]
MSGSWEAMLEDEQRQSDLTRRRELARLSKVELIDLVVTTEHEIGSQS